MVCTVNVDVLAGKHARRAVGIDVNNVTALLLLPLGYVSPKAKANSCANVSHGTN